MVPALVAVDVAFIGGPEVALFTAIGGFATLLFVDFTGPLRERLSAQIGLVLAGAVLVCLGTLASQAVWAAVVATFVIALLVLFTGVISSVLAGASTSLLVGFVLPVTLPGSAGSLPDRVGGWLLAGAASLIAITVLWPAPVREPLRRSTARACALLARRLRAEVEYVDTGFASASGTAVDASAQEATTAVLALRTSFFATSYRTTGLTTEARALMRLMDQVVWLDAILTRAPMKPRPRSIAGAVRDVETEAATLLEHGAALLESLAGDTHRLDSDLGRLLPARDSMEHTVTSALPDHITRAPPRRMSDDEVSEFVGSLEPGFRAQEMTCAISAIAANIGLVVAARRRGWWQRLLGHHPGAMGPPLASARERLGAHAERHSVWLHNSVRGATALSLAVLVAELTGVRHSFWVVFGTLTVLCSNALNTGQNAVRGLLGTVVGFLVGGGLIFALGTDTTVCWLLIPLALAVAGLAPDTTSYIVGQTGFTTALLLLYNLIDPGGWRIGLVRLEDVAIGCAVSIVIGALFWPRGASSVLGRALAEAFDGSARYLRGALAYGLTRGDARLPSAPAPREERRRAASAAGRLDDAFRGYLAERGTKQVPLAGMTRLVNAVLVLRFTADAVLRLWQRADRAPTAEHTAASAELLRAGGVLVDWYERTARALAGEGPVPAPVDTGLAAGRLIEAVSRDLAAADAGDTAADGGGAAAAAIGMFWTAEHIDAVQRLRAVLLEPARAASEQRLPRSWLTGHDPGQPSGHTGAPAAEVEGGYGRA